MWPTKTAMKKAPRDNPVGFTYFTGVDCVEKSKRVYLLKHVSGKYLSGSWRGIASLDNILNAQQFRNVAAAKAVRTRLRNGDEFSVVEAVVTIKEETV